LPSGHDDGVAGNFTVHLDLGRIPAILSDHRANLRGPFMIFQRGLAVASLLLLGACVSTAHDNRDENGFILELPEDVVAIAAPGQNLRAVRIMPEDGCYWYQHVNVVEATMLPLLTADGRRICTRAQS